MSAYRQSAIGNHRRGLVVRTGLAHVAWAAALVVGCGTATPPIASNGIASASPSGIPVATAMATAMETPAATVSTGPSPTPIPTPTATASPPATATYVVKDCVRNIEPGWSVARQWDETALNLIRQNPPAPTIAARNLFDLSAVMWDAWAAYDPTAVGYFTNEKHTAADVAEARTEAISYAAFNLLRERYFGDAHDVDPSVSIVMQQLCLYPNYSFPIPAGRDTPGDLGRTIAIAAIAAGKIDGSLEDEGYADSTFTPANRPLPVYKSATTMKDPNSWQPLQYTRGGGSGQGGGSAPDVQVFIGAQWGHVTPFALPVTSNWAPIDPGPPPALGSDATLDAEYKQAAIDVLTYSSTLDASDGV